MSKPLVSDEMWAIVTSGPTHRALSNQGEVSLLLVMASLAATLSGLLLTGFAVRILARSHVAYNRDHPPGLAGQFPRRSETAYARRPLVPSM